MNFTKIFKKVFSIVTIFFVSQWLFADVRYIEIENIRNAPIIEIKNLNDLEAIIAEYGINIVFLQKVNPSMDSNNRMYNSKLNTVPPKVLYVITDFAYFSFQMNGFDSLTDYRSGLEQNFNNGYDYYKALKLGISDGEIYSYYLRNNFSSVEQCLNAYKNGFVANKSINSNNYSLLNKKEDEAYFDALQKGFETFHDYEEYVEYTSKNFKSKADWEESKRNKYSTAKDFYDSKDGLFNDAETFYHAKTVGITTNKDYQIYKKIVSSIESIIEDKKLDKKSAVIFYYIKNLPKGEQSSAILSKSLKLDIQQQSENLNKALVLWYADNKTVNQVRGNQGLSPSLENLFNVESVKRFLVETDVSELGTYNSDTDIFRKK